MKKYCLIGVKLAITLLFFLFCSFSLLAQTDKPHFNINSLSKEQLEQFSHFRKLKGKDRFDLFLKISSVIPNSNALIDSTDNSKMIIDQNSVPSIMTKKDLFKLLGKAWKTRKVRTYDYLLDKASTNCIVSFFFNENDEIIFYAYSNCVEHWNEQDAKIKK